MLRGGQPFGRDIHNFCEQQWASALPLNPNPQPTMNPPQLDDDPLKIHEAVIATAYVTAACASLAICFAILAACESAKGVLKRLSRKGAQRVP